ncbi:MAG: glycosyltransferase [Alphaproteobacteria bacterium]|nr:glycosyltransferase [Alphaproteobacteria bacterium]
MSENELELSVVIPLFNEAGNVLPLVDEIAATLEAYTPVGQAYEILCVDDGSDDATAKEVTQSQQKNAHVRLIKHAVRMGMSSAIRNGVRRARARWILTIDGDRQNDPADAPKLLDLAWMNGKDRKVLVAGVRVNRQDTWGKRLASKIANKIRRAFLKDNCPDTGCSLKVFPRDSYLELPFFNGLHRFMPALLKLYGHACIFSSVNDRPRMCGVSKSDFIGRMIRSTLDLLGVIWLVRHTPGVDRGEEVPAQKA